SHPEPRRGGSENSLPPIQGGWFFHAELNGLGSSLKLPGRISVLDTLGHSNRRRWQFNGSKVLRVGGLGILSSGSTRRQFGSGSFTKFPIKSKTPHSFEWGVSVASTTRRDPGGEMNNSMFLGIRFRSRTTRRIGTLELFFNAFDKFDDGQQIGGQFLR